MFFIMSNEKKGGCLLLKIIIMFYLPFAQIPNSIG